MFRLLPRRLALVAGLLLSANRLAAAQSPAVNPAVPALDAGFADAGAPDAGAAEAGAPDAGSILAADAGLAAAPAAKPAPVVVASAPAPAAPAVTAAKPAAPTTPGAAPAVAEAEAANPDGGEDMDDSDDDGANADEIREQSEDLAAMRQAETTFTDPGAGAATQLFSAARRLGGNTCLAMGLHDALGDERSYQPLLPDAAALDPGIALAFDIAKAKGEYDIPVEMRGEVAQWIGFFQRSGRKYFRHYLGRSTRYIPVMRDILRQEGIPEDTVFLSMIESGFSTMAYSWARASGPWQFVEHTGQRYGLRVDFWVDERRDPIKSTRAAAKYLRALHDEFGDWYLAWAGYNAGENKIRKGIIKYDTHDFWQMCTEKRFFRNETKNYVPKLIAAALVTKHASQFGFTKDEIEWEEPLETDEVKVVNATDLNVLAKAADCSVDDLKLLNPELKRWLTPPATDEKPYVLRVPKGHKVAFDENYPRVAPKERMQFKIVRVKKGDTLSKIALENRSYPEAVMRMNGLTSVRKLRIGTELMVPVSSQAALAKIDDDTKAGKRKKYDASDEIPAGQPTGPQQASGTVVHRQVDGKDQVTYGVASGDNLWLISQKFGVSVDELKGWNNLKGKRPKLAIGQQLVLYPRALPPASPKPATTPSPAVNSAPVQLASTNAPAPAAAPKPPPVDAVPDKVTVEGNKKHIVHTLAPGDSLWSLSQRYGVSVDELKKLNHVSKHKKLRAGDTLVIEVAERS